MYEISNEIYSDVAEKLCEAIDSRDFFSGSVDGSNDYIDYRLTVTLMVYRREVVMPEGTFLQISNLIPVWWEFSTTGAEGERLNDFDFAQLRETICQ